MILYKKEPIPVQMKNVMLLDDSVNGGVVYVSKTTYDQALLLYGRLDGNVDRLIQMLDTINTQNYIFNAGLKGLLNTMRNCLPKPINMLAPYIIFCAKNEGIEWDAENYEMGYGILHQFSQIVDFNATALAPAACRAEITLPTVILMDYQTSWDELCKGLYDNVVMQVKSGNAESVSTTQSLPQIMPVYIPAPTIPQGNQYYNMPSVGTVPVPATTQVEQPTNVQTSEDSDLPEGLTDELFDSLGALLDEFDDIDTAEENNDNKETKESKPIASEPKPLASAGESLSTDKAVQEAVEANAVLDEFDV